MEKAIYHAKQDPKYQQPFVDLEESRERHLPDGTVLPYLYVHGGFEGTGVKFAFSFPEKNAFEGRFFQYLSPFPGPDEELASQPKQGEDDIIAFSLLHGGYFVESNMGSGAAFGQMPDNTIVWKSSAAVGSSKTRICGCAASALAISTSCSSPPLICPQLLPIRCVTPASSIA